MIKIYPAESRFTAEHGWLKSNFSFSFAEYHDPENIDFGPMRVLNDDIIQPMKGFGRHPHREMEIVSLVLKGELKHEDSTGGAEILRVGEVQRMSAGTGIIHSEVNSSAAEETHLLQMWFRPNEQGLQPSYEQIVYDQQEMQNQWLPVVSHRPTSENTATIHQDMTLYLSKLETNQALSFTQKDNRRMFFFVIEGSIILNQEHALHRRDSARISNQATVDIQAKVDSYVMLIDLP